MFESCRVHHSFFAEPVTSRNPTQRHSTLGETSFVVVHSDNQGSGGRAIAGFQVAPVLFGSCWQPLMLEVAAVALL